MKLLFGLLALLFVTSIQASNQRATQLNVKVTLPSIDIGVSQSARVNAAVAALEVDRAYTDPETGRSCHLKTSIEQHLEIAASERNVSAHVRLALITDCPRARAHFINVDLARNWELSKEPVYLYLMLPEPVLGGVTGSN